MRTDFSMQVADPFPRPNTRLDQPPLHPWGYKGIFHGPGGIDSDRFEVDTAPVLLYPVILGRDCPEFSRVLQTVGLQGTPTQMALEGDNPDEKNGGTRSRGP